LPKKKTWMIYRLLVRSRGTQEHANIEGAARRVVRWELRRICLECMGGCAGLGDGLTHETGVPPIPGRPLRRSPCCAASRWPLVLRHGFGSHSARTVESFRPIALLPVRSRTVVARQLQRANPKRVSVLVHMDRPESYLIRCTQRHDP
jgi:hypothetical protein